ncbi:hypothetical protein ANTQUA_LOCUS6074 [Anthophora quadrimaculata]
MALTVRSNRSKSTSDILDEIVKTEGTSKGSSFLVGNQCRTSEDLRSERKCSTKDSTHEGKRQQSMQKSQNFVKKLIASLEKRNEACKADDEFFTKLYKKNEHSNYSLDRKHQFSYGMKVIEKEIPFLYTETNRSTLPNDETERNSSRDVCVENKVPVFPDIKRNKQVATRNENLKDSKFAVSREEENNLEIDKQNKMYDEIQFDVNENKERKKFLNSSFDTYRSRFELESQIDVANSYFLKKTEKRRKSTLERIFVNSKGDEKSKRRIFNGTSKKKLNRNKSFKDLLGSMIKWRKSERKDRSRYFMSCDHLLAESESFGSENDKKLPRASSFPAVVFQEVEEDNFKENTERKATIRPIYGGKRNDQHLQIFTKKRENRKFFVTEESAEDLVKPSNVRKIAKHLSQVPQKLRNNLHN